MHIKLGNVAFKEITLTLLVPLVGHNANLFIIKHVYEASGKCLNAVKILRNNFLSSFFQDIERKY